MNHTQRHIDLAALAAPFAPTEHSWRAQQIARDGTRALALCYITARAVQNRLDTVCGPAGWQVAYDETASGRVIATISLNIGEEWIAKADGAGATAMEGDKGGMSDAFKRAAVMWSIGRYLYSLPAVWAECDVERDREGQIKLGRNGKPVFRRWTPAGQRTLDAALPVLARAERSAPVQPNAPGVIDFADKRAERAAGKPAEADPGLHNPALAKSPPAIVTAMVDGLRQAIAQGEGAQFWAAHFPQMPAAWRPYLVAEKDKLQRKAG
jgi:hypothetical protein